MPNNQYDYDEILDQDTYDLSTSSPRFDRSDEENSAVSLSTSDDFLTCLAGDDEESQVTEKEAAVDEEGDTISVQSQFNFFEGAEKRLVIYFKENGSSDLRKITRNVWENILNLVNCRILNVVCNERLDGYLLSESSMFVSKNRFILKTCGSTTLLHCLEPLLQTIAKMGFNLIEDIFYSHKNLLVPSLQMHPHHSFIKECEYLDKIFNGYSHLFGHINADRWYLYTLGNQLTSMNDFDEEDDIKTVNFKTTNKNEHFKFEMIMEELDEDITRMFYRDDCQLTAAQVTRKSRIDTLIPGMMIDDYLFTPCGYSMNGMIGDRYMTIHITPESDFSYASVETDVPQRSYSLFINKLISVFKPRKFMLNLFVPSIHMKLVNSSNTEREANNANVNHVGDKSDRESPSTKNTVDDIHGLMICEELLCASGFLPDYRRCDFQMMQYNHSDIIYARYSSEGIS